MKTIKIDEEAYLILTNFKYYGGKKTYSDTIKSLKEYCEDLLHYKTLYLKEHEK